MASCCLSKNVMREERLEHRQKTPTTSTFPASLLRCGRPSKKVQEDNLGLSTARRRLSVSERQRTGGVYDDALLSRLGGAEQRSQQSQSGTGQNKRRTRRRPSHPSTTGEQFTLAARSTVADAKLRPM
uniref:Uncharacterized protein n=1 Tax=Plectus sambesii TaxID=2011161 RepID=A0A914XA15_9BILA